MLKLPDWVYETSMNYINRFFLTRSISKNDRHLVVGGAILLASKVQESPRSVKDVAYVLLHLKNANKQKAQQAPDQTTLEQFMEGVILAEQAVLFSLNFNLNVETHVSLTRRLLEPLDLWAKPNPAPGPEAEANQLKLSLINAVMFFLNDSALTNLSLQYPNSKVAPVALIMAAKRLAARGFGGREAPPTLQRVLALANDAEWLESKGLTQEAAADIEAQINELYATSPAQPASGTVAAPQRHQVPGAQEQPPASAAGNGRSLQQAHFPRSEHQAQPQHQPQTEVLAEQAVAGGGQDATAPASNPVQDGPEGRPIERAACNVSSVSLLRRGSPSPAVLEPLTSAVGAALTPQCGGGLGHPSSSAAALPAGGMTAEGTPELPHPPSPQQQMLPVGARVLHQAPDRACKRRSDGDDCTVGDQQATSELHEAPEQRLDAEVCLRPGTDADGAGALDGPGACNGNDDLANENCSPEGLTTGNASGSGCGVVEGQPEVCSRPDAGCCEQMQSRPSEPQLASSTALRRPTQPQPQQCAKRCRAALEGDGFEAGVLGIRDVALAPLIKTRRVDQAHPLAMQP